MPRLNILKDKDIALFDSPPQFTEEERAQFFVLPDNDVKFRKIETKIGYILQEGYFLSQQKFFLPNQYYKEDVEYVTKICGVKREIKIENHYHRAIHNIHKLHILEKHKYKSFSDYKGLFEKEASELVKSASNPKEIFYDLGDFLKDKKVEVPGYYSFTEIITKALNIFENELIKIVDNALTAELKELLDGFMYMPVDSSRELSSKNPYLITHLKKAEQAMAPLKIKESLTDFHHIKELHENLSGFFSSNLISNELVNYYAVWMLKADHTQFDQISDIQNKRLYVTSFISYQYKMRQDYFVDTFLQTIQKYYNDTEKNIARRFLEQNLKYNKQEQVGKIRNIISGTREQLHKISEIVYSVSLDDSKKMELILDILDKAGLGSHDEVLDELDKLENTGAKSLKDQLLYEELAKGYRRLSNRVSAILQALEFNPQSSKPEIYDAIIYFQQKAGKIKENDAPLEFIPRKEWKRLFPEDGPFNANLYKIFLFKAVFDGIKSGKLNLLFSERYKYVDDYLISTERWRKDRTELLSRVGLWELDKDPQEILDNLKVSLSNRYKTTNENIESNQYIKFDAKGIAKVKTPKLPDSEEGGVGEFIGKEKLVPLVRILADVTCYTDYISSFTHYNRKNVKSTPSIESMYAAIIALGCNIEVRKMGKISEGISADILEYVVRWFFSKENIDEANRKVIALINSLPLSGIYLDNENRVNTSSDGQKYNVRAPSLNAGRSPKYFGMDNIVSAYSSIDAKGRLTFGRVHSPKYRESTFVADVLFHNPDVVSDTHATDTHGYTEIVFGICHLLGVEFTPRIKNYHEQLLYTFKTTPRKVYESKGYKILPAKSMYINEQAIWEQWDQVLRFLCTIKLRETLPSNILKRLSSYSRQHPLHKALKEVGRIYKTSFLLRYYDELALRQDIEKQLNRIELSHLFAHAVFFGGNQEFNYATKEEQDMALGCRQLIQNSIVLWNYLYISEKLSEVTCPVEQQRQINRIRNSSIMTWQHVNMHGRYDFNLETTQIPFDFNKIKSLIIN